MSTAPAAAPAPPPPPDEAAAFAAVIQHAMDNVKALTKLADGIAAKQPAVARHVRELAAEGARRTLDCLRLWPT